MPRRTPPGTTSSSAAAMVGTATSARTMESLIMKPAPYARRAGRWRPSAHELGPRARAHRERAHPDDARRRRGEREAIARQLIEPAHVLADRNPRTEQR